MEGEERKKQTDTGSEKGMKVGGQRKIKVGGIRPCMKTSIRKPHACAKAEWWIQLCGP